MTIASVNEHHLYERHIDGLRSGGETEAATEARPTRVYGIAASAAVGFVAESNICRCHHATGTSCINAGAPVSVEYNTTPTTDVS